MSRIALAPARARFINLKRIEDEILAQNGQRRCLPNLADPAEIALKKIFFRDHGDGARARRSCKPSPADAGSRSALKTPFEGELSSLRQ